MILTATLIIQQGIFDHLCSDLQSGVQTSSVDPFVFDTEDDPGDLHLNLENSSDDDESDDDDSELDSDGDGLECEEEEIETSDRSQTTSYPTPLKTCFPNGNLSFIVCRKFRIRRLSAKFCRVNREYMICSSLLL